jgi:hypothetical protein
MQDILNKTPTQKARTTAQGPTEEVPAIPHTPEDSSQLNSTVPGAFVHSQQEDLATSTTNPLAKFDHEPSATETQTRPPYFKYPEFGVIGGIGMGIGVLGLSGIPWIATYAEDQISYVTIGDAGNLPDPFAYPESWGSVDYEFEMSTTPVTQGQWLTYLNAVAKKEDPNNLWNNAMPIIRNGMQGCYSYSLKDPEMHHKPITHVSYTNAKSYCQWQSDTSGNSENTNSAITYDIPTPDEYLKAHFYNPKALEEHGDYESTPCDAYGTEPPQENFYEWTSADTEKEPFILSKLASSPSDVETVKQATETLDTIEREDLGFSVVKRTHVSFNQQNRQEKEYLEKMRSYCQTHSQDNNDLWANANDCLAMSLSSLSPKIQKKYQQIAICYITSMEALNLKNFSQDSHMMRQQVSDSWLNAGVYIQENMNELCDSDLINKNNTRITRFLHAAIEYRLGNKNTADAFYEQGNDVQ